MPGPPGKRVRKAVAEVERGPMPSLAVSPPPAHRASRQILIDSDDVDLRIAEKPERVHVAAYGQRQSTYAQLRSWIAACHPRGTFRGTVFCRFQRSGCRQCDLRAISAASACAARGHPSCKRQVSGSIPLTGSQAFARSGTVRTTALGESARLAPVTAAWPREATLA